jgi:hypothetical protein
MVLLGLLAMSAQSLLVQTHVHTPRAAGKPVAAVAEAGSPLAALPSGDAQPSHPQTLPDHALKCPLCQQWHGAGQFVAPGSALLTLPLNFRLSLAVLDDPAFAVQVLAHAWHGRAPPEKS